MIFKTFDSDIDKISSKWGMFGRSFDDIGTAIHNKIISFNEEFEQTGKIIDSWKNSDSIWARLYPSKETIKEQLIDVDKLIPKIDENQASKILGFIKSIEDGTNEETKSFQELYDTGNKTKQWIAEYAQSTKDQIRSTEGVIQANKQARASALANNEAIKSQTLSAKAGKVALQALATVGNMFLMWAISKGIELVVKGIDKLVHSAEYAEKAIKAATDSAESFSKAINDIQKNTADMESRVNSIAKRYAELSQGVNPFTNENKTLPTDEYEEFLNLNEQLAELFPSLTKNYDENGHMILGLSGSVDSVTASIQALVDQEKELAKARIRENLEQYFNGTDEADGAWRALEGRKQSLEEVNAELENLTNTYDNLINSDSTITLGRFYKDFAYRESREYLEYIENYFGKDIANSINDAISIRYGQGLTRTLADVVIDFSSLELTETQKEQIIRSYDTFYDELLAKQNTAMSELESQNSEFSNNAMLWLEDLSFYKNNDRYIKTAIESLVSNIDWSNYDKEELNYDGVKRILQDSILTPFQVACNNPNNQELLNESLEKLFTLDTSEMNPDDAKSLVDQYINDIARILHKNSLDLKIQLGFDNIDQTAENYQKILHNAAQRISGASDREIMNAYGNYEKYHEIYAAMDEFANKYSINAQDELTYFQYALEKANYDIDKAFELYLSKMQDDSDGDTFTPTISSSVEQISRQLEPQFSKLGDAYSSIFSLDGDYLNSVDNTMLEGLRKSFAEIEEDLGVTFDASQLNDFFNVLTDGTSTVNEVHDAFNDLATAYFYSTDTLEHLNEATAESIKQQLEQMGVVNSEEIIDHYLQLAEAENGLLELQDQLAEAKKDLAESSNRGEYENARAKIDLIYEQIEAYYNEKSATEDLRIALFNLQLQQAGLSIESINSSASVSELLRLASAAGLSAEYMDKLVRLQELINLYHSTTNGNMQSAIELEIQSDKSSLKDMLDVSQIGLEIDFPSGKDSGAGSAGKDAAEEYLEGFNNELDRLKFLQDNRIITEKEYLDQLRILYEKYFKDKEEYLEEYVKYEHEYLNGLKSLYEDVLGGITDLLDQQIDKTEEERDAKVDALEEEQEARTKVLAQQKEQLDLQIEEIEAQIKGKNDAIDAINDEIDAIRKANDERQRQIDLQKAIYDLERMQNQRTILQYSEDKGMHYVSDTSGIRDAKDAVDDAKREIEIAEKEKQIALIEDEISLLETRKSLIEDQQADLDKQIDALDEYYKKLIENTEAYYSALIQPIENYKTQFESIADFESDATFDEQLKSLGYSVDDILALSSSTLENFKSNYLGILSDIYAGNSQMLDSLSMVSGLDHDEFVGYLSQSQPYIDSLSRLDLSSTQLAIDSANSGIYSFADGAVLATTNMTTMADTVTSLLEGDKKQAGIISSFETMTSVLADANTQIAGIASGMEELDGKTATIRINIETNGDTSLLGNAFVSGTAITGASHVEGTALASGNWAVQSNEKNALVGEVGRELIVRGGRFFTVGNYGAEMFNIKKGDIVFNHEQTEALLKNGHISGRGKAYADGTVGGGRILTADGRILRPLQESDKGFELLQKFQPLVDRIIKGEEGLITNAVFDSQKQFEQMLKSVMNTTAINNISNNRNSQPVVHQQFNITMPNVTNSTSAEILMNDLQSLSTKKFQMEW